jgi:RimJ/RimL family protein N-acetyltransferase
LTATQTELHGAGEASLGAAFATIQTERLTLRELRISDVTQTYLAWLRDPAAQRWIAGADQDLSGLREYVHERIGRFDVLFLGIFDRQTGIHIGNIKFEPVSRERALAVMGVLIGDPRWRGQHVFGEALKACAGWLKQHCGIEQISLGVDVSNTAALRAYQKSGFVIQTPEESDRNPRAIAMLLRL